MKRLIDLTLIIVFALVLWQGVVWVTDVPSFILPGPIRVFHALVDNVDLLATHTLSTAIEVFVGLFLGVFLGAATALQLTVSSTTRRYGLPLMVLSQAIPVFALAPMLTLWLGYGLWSKIAMTTMIIYFPVASNFYDGLRQTDPGLLDLARVMSARPAQILLRLQVPAALPSLGSGLRLAAVYAPIGAVIGEWVGASSGLGYLMLLANGRAKIDLMFAALLVLCVFTVALHASVAWLVTHMTRWSQGGHSGRNNHSPR